jgi:hypothetical protein
MPTKKLTKQEKSFLIDLGKRVESIIKQDMKYSSHDAFSLEHHESIGKATVYQICDGKRDMKLTTLLRLCRALDVAPEDLIKDLWD